MDKNREIVLLGDLKGTKHFLENCFREDLEFRLFTVHEALFACVRKYGNMSSSLEAFTFSDSILVRWKDYIEGTKKCVPFSEDLWSRISQLPYRIFIDAGDVLNDNVPISQQIIRSKRFINVIPVSYAFWSVCVAEAEHFPEGIFIGKELWKITTKTLSDEVFEAKQFLYKKILFE